MEKQDLIKLKEKLSKLSEEEEKQRKIYLRDLATGKLQGPPVGYPTIDKPWYKFYEEDSLLRDTEHSTIYETLVKNNADNDGIAINYFGNKIKYNELIKLVDKVATSFKNAGVKKGDIVTLSLANTPENCISIYALNKIGAIANLIDLRLKDDKLVHAINSTGSKVLLTTDLFVENLNAVRDKLNVDKIVMCSPFDSINKPFGPVLKTIKAPKIPKELECIKWDEFLNSSKLENMNITENVTEDDPVCIVHTSGTTGEPKGVVLTSRNFNTMVNEYKDNVVKTEKGDRILSQVPPFLAYSAIMGLHLPLSLGIRLEMLPDYNPNKFAENLYKHKTAHAVAGPADWSNFLEDKKVAKRDYSFLKTLGSGSDKIPTEKRHEINKILANSGSELGVMEGYGMSEVGSAAVTNLPRYIVDDSVGIPLSKMDICIVDENNNELPYNQIGEICFSGGTMMMGYLNNREATNEIIHIGPDGKKWLHSGDIGYMNENGNIFLQGRIKRIIVRYDGFKVFPFDLEKVIQKNPCVENCCVVGIPNIEKNTGAMPVAAVVLKEEYRNDVDNQKQIIKDSCVAGLGERYQPEEIFVLDELPLTDVGKVDYRRLEKELAIKYANNYSIKK